ncbi:hypothetical protein F5Y14DRAFT_449956 [Nemania sp. NC0429]|nr:hypothetical protein F5Y14DRAFT_449956 [Nemania sp. NC0429]
MPKRQQSFQGGSAKRHCPTQQSAREMQRAPAQLDQSASGPSNSQPWSYPPQVNPLPERPSAYNININTTNGNSNTFMHPNSMITSRHTPTPRQMQQGSIQQGPRQQGQMQAQPMQLAPLETPGFKDGFNQTFAPTQSMGWYPTNHIIQAPQGAMSESYSPRPQQPNQFQFNQQLWTTRPAPLNRAMSRPPIGEAVNTGSGTLATQRNTPQRASLPLAQTRSTSRRTRHVSKDAAGVDTTGSGQPQPSVPPTPSLQTDKAPEGSSQLDSAAPESAGDQAGQNQQHEERRAEVPRPNSIDNPVVIDDTDDSNSEECARINDSHNPVVVDDNQGGLALLKEYLARARQDDVTKEAETATEDKRPDIRWYGDPAQFPPECFEILRTKACQFRARAICVGWPGPKYAEEHGEIRGSLRWVVYAVHERYNIDNIIFKVAKSGLSVPEVMDGLDIQFSDIRLNVNFEDMDERMVVKWTKYLLNAVPGYDDTITKWQHV